MEGNRAVKPGDDAVSGGGGGSVTIVYAGDSCEIDLEILNAEAIAEAFDLDFVPSRLTHEDCGGKKKVIPIGSA